MKRNIKADFTKGLDEELISIFTDFMEYYSKHSRVPCDESFNAMILVKRNLLEIYDFDFKSGVLNLRVTELGKALWEQINENNV